MIIEEHVHALPSILTINNNYYNNNSDNIFEL